MGTGCHGDERERCAVESAAGDSRHVRLLDEQAALTFDTVRRLQAVADERAEKSTVVGVCVVLL